jgi:hypothetical protein
LLSTTILGLLSGFALLNLFSEVILTDISKLHQVDVETSKCDITAANLGLAAENRELRTFSRVHLSSGLVKVAFSRATQDSKSLIVNGVV